MNFMLPVPEASVPAVEICSDKSEAGITREGGGGGGGGGEGGGGDIEHTCCSWFMAYIYIIL